MTPAEVLSSDLAEAAQALRAKDEAFAFATIVRTAGATAAKPGAKALLSADGTIVHGWLGGGCTRGAVKKAAITALQSGRPQLIS
ncbi:MAG: XdhC family protein, partial [Pseudomonadota bacterium]